MTTEEIESVNINCASNNYYNTNLTLEIHKIVQKSPLKTSLSLQLIATRAINDR